MRTTTLVGSTQLDTRNQPLDRLMDEDCRESIGWAIQDRPGWVAAVPEPVRCAHGRWENAAEGMPRSLGSVHEKPTLYMWHGPTGWHLTASGARDAIVTGSIMTDGVVDGLVPHFLSPATVGIATTTNGFRFRIKLAAGTAGLDFRVGCGSHLSATAFSGGNRLEPSEIIIGDNGCHPDSVPFRISRVTQGRIIQHQSERR